jgi:hypothetical protein
LIIMFAGHSTRALAAATLQSAACKKQLFSTSKQLSLRLRSNRSRTSTTLRHKSTVSRNKSTAAALADDGYDDFLKDHSSGHASAAAMKARGSLGKSHEEAWMINLGRENENEWLLGPRPQEWFTGLPPSKCPGK